jgi:hypothetical protein
MTTTIMKDSRVGDAWIRQACMEAPAQKVMVLNKQTGQTQWNGNLLTGPVRLAFTDSVLTPMPKQKSDPTSELRHSVTILFTPFTDMQLFWGEWNRIAQSDFANYWNGQQYAGLDIPIFNAGMKAQYAGFTPNLYAMNSTSKYKPSVVDRGGNPVIDPSRIYPGVWAIVAVNAYASGKGQARKGPRFGLQAIMILADDTNLAGAPPDPRVLFQGVNITPPTNAPALGTFGAQPPQGAPLGGAQVIGQFYPPSGQPAAGGAPQAALVDPMKQFGF